MRRFVTWTALVSGCALPLALVTWTRFPAEGHLGEICGIAVWIAVAATVDHRFAHTSSVLRSGALCLMVLQWLASAALPPLGLYVLYAPAVWMATSLALISDTASDFHGAFVLTVMCGAQCAVVAAVLARVAESVLALRAKVR